MEAILHTKNVPFFKLIKLEYLKVDISNVLIVLLVLIPNTYSFSQQSKKHDSLFKIYNTLEDGIPKVKILESLFYENVYNDPRQGEIYARLSRTLSKKIDNKEGLGVAMYHIGVSKQLQTELDSALYYYKETVDYFKLIDDKPHYASTVSAISDIERRRGNYTKAISYIKESIKIHKDLKDQLRYGIGVGNLGSIYDDMGNKKLAIEKSIEALRILDTVTQEPWRKADILRGIGRIELDRKNFKESLIYLNKALDVYKDNNDNIWQAYTLTDIGNNYLDSEKYNEAEQAYLEALDLANTFDLKDTRTNIIGNLGSINYERGNYFEARKNIHEALNVNRSINDIVNILSNLILITKIELKTKNYAAANKAIQEGLKLSDSLNKFDIEKEFYYYKATLLADQGAYQGAFNNLNTYIKIKDSLNKVNSAKQIDEIKISFETEQKEKEILLKTNEIKLLEERNQKAENQRLFFIITALGILLFSISVFYGLHQKMKRNKLEREKLDKDLEFKEKELTTHALHLAHKNEILYDLKSQLKAIKSESFNSRSYQNVINTINLDINNDNNWEQFRTYFEDVHKDFNSKVMRNYPTVSNNDLRLMSLLKMNLSSKEIANILNISIEGVKKARYRLRKKLNLTSEESLQELVIDL
jgi:tetratricopeptide (TPR) repeat protein